MHWNVITCFHNTRTYGNYTRPYLEIYHTFSKCNTNSIKDSTDHEVTYWLSSLFLFPLFSISAIVLFRRFLKRDTQTQYISTWRSKIRFSFTFLYPIPIQIYHLFSQKNMEDANWSLDFVTNLPHV